MLQPPTGPTVPRPLSHPPALLACAVLLGLGFGCGPKLVREPVYASDNVRVTLRRTLERGKPIARGYAHPATISDVRLAHILANIENQDKDGKRQPTIPSELVYDLAEGLNKAAAKAGPDDEIAAVAFLENRRLGLFTTRRVTSFRMYFTPGDLVFEFYDVGRALEPGEGRPGKEEYAVPTSAPESASFRVLSSPGQAAEGARKLKVDWRDPYFSRPVSLSVMNGRFKRRTVLSESPAPPDSEAPPQLDSKPQTRDAQIRALDQLDAARRSGLVTELEFQQRRRLILEGKLQEAGYGSAPDPGSQKTAPDPH
jgi:hypothetical protein